MGLWRGSGGCFGCEKARKIEKGLSSGMVVKGEGRAYAWRLGWMVVFSFPSRVWLSTAWFMFMIPSISNSYQARSALFPMFP